MLNYSQLYNELKYLVGFRQTENPTNDLISEDLTKSESGLYINDLAYNWLNARNFELCIPDYRSYSYTEWSNATNYTINTRIKYQNKIYYALQAHTNQNPASQPTYWQLIGDLPSLTAYLERTRESAIKELLNDVLRANYYLNDEKNLLDNGFGTVLQGDLKQRNNVSTNRFRGYQLIPNNRKDIQLQLLKIGVKVSQAQNLTVRIYHSSQTTPIKSYSVAISADDVNKFVWKDLKDANGVYCTLNYLQSITNSGGAFYIGLFESEITGNITEYDLMQSSYVYNPIFERFKGLTFINEIEVKEADLNGTNLFNLDNVGFTYGQNIFNLELVAYSDKTPLIIETKKLWIQAVQYKIACKLLKDMFQSKELNRIVSHAEKEVGYLLYGNKEQEIKGFEDILKMEIKALVHNYTNNAEGFDEMNTWSYNFH